MPSVVEVDWSADPFTLEGHMRRWVLRRWFLGQLRTSLWVFAFPLPPLGIFQLIRHVNAILLLLGVSVMNYCFPLSLSMDDILLPYKLKRGTSNQYFFLRRTPSSSWCWVSNIFLNGMCWFEVLWGCPHDPGLTQYPINLSHQELDMRSPCPFSSTFLCVLHALLVLCLQQTNISGAWLSGWRESSSGCLMSFCVFLIAPSPF